MMWCNT